MTDGTTTRRLCRNVACLLTGTIDETTTPPPASRHDDNGTQNITANCYPPHDTKN